MVEQQIQLHIEITQEMLSYENYGVEFMKTINAGEETWICGYHSRTKFQPSQ